MDGIIVSVDPVLARPGPLAVRWFGVLFALAVIDGIGLGLREAHRKGIVGDRAQTLAALQVVRVALARRIDRLCRPSFVDRLRPRRTRR